MKSDDDILEQLAQDGTMDYSQWPGLLERILPRLEKIAYNDFTISKNLLQPPRTLIPSRRDELPAFRRDNPSSRETPSPDSQKENVMPGSPLNRQPAQRPRSASTPPISERPVSESRISEPPSTFHPQLLSLLSSIKSGLETQFAKAPPHTAQRFAELVLRPTSHYRTLPSYLRALDRVISVSSPANVFPLPDLLPHATSNGRILNGSLTPMTSATPNAYDFFGGAELSPIPWLNGARSPSYQSTDHATTTDLRTESTSLIDEPNGAGSVETVTVNGMSRAGHEGLSRHDEALESTSTASEPVYGDKELRGSDTSSEAVEEERVSARGPEEIGMADTGPQAPRSGGFDIEAALGRKGEGEHMIDTGSEKERQDGDGDYVIIDAEEASEQKVP